MESPQEGRLPERPDLEQLKKQAKELRASGAHSTLSAAQRALALQYGFASWPRLKHAVELATLRRLIEDGDAAGIRALLESSPRIAKASFADGETPLHLAAQCDFPMAIELLVESGAPVQARYGKSAHSALSWAITCWSFQAAQKLVDLGNEPDLFCAAGLGDMKRLRAFWKGGKLRRKPSTTGSSRYTDSRELLPCPPEADQDQVSDALYLACRSNRLEAARWLLDHGADPNWRGYCGATCLAWAEFSGNAELCALLRERGGSDDLLDQDYKADPGTFALMVFAGWGFPKLLVERLTNDRSLVEVRSGRGTLLHAAAAGGQQATVQILLLFGADRNALDPEGRTPLKVATEKGHTELVEILR